MPTTNIMFGVPSRTPETQFASSTPSLSFPFRCIGIRAVKVLTGKQMRTKPNT